MRRAVRWLLGFAVGFGLTLAAVEVSRNDSAPGAGALLGRLDVGRFCAIEYGAGATAVVRPGTEAQWVCEGSDGVLQPQPIDTLRACEVLYGPPAYSTALRVRVDTVVWDCYRGPAP